MCLGMSTKETKTCTVWFEKRETIMKKAIVTIIVLAIALTAAFATTSTATLDLTTTVEGKTFGLIAKGTTIPSLDQFADMLTNGSNLDGSTYTFTDNLSADFVYAFQTNLQIAPEVKFTATELKSSEGNHLTYTVDGHQVTSTPITETLIPAGTPSTEGLRVLGKTFKIALDQDSYNNAAAGTYNATLTINIVSSN